MKKRRRIVYYDTPSFNLLHRNHTTPDDKWKFMERKYPINTSHHD
ncbi:hypothetical protein [Phocaeicola vulgatus]